MDRRQFSAPSVLEDCKDTELTDGQERGHGVQRIMYSDTMELVEPTVVIKNGLKLRRQATGKDEDYGSYSYALSPLTVAPKGIDWKIIVPSGADIDCDHIHCHEIKPDDNLDVLIAECHANHAVAVVLVNCDDNYSLPETVQSHFTKTDYPVLVLTAIDGKKLLKTLIEEDDDGDFEAKILEKEPTERGPGISKLVELQSYSATYHKSSDVGKLADIHKHFRMRIKKFLHHSGNATCVSEDPEQLKQVVATFDEYEQQLCSLEVFSNSASNECICDDLNKWRDNCELGKEFPICLVLANMLLRKRSLYACKNFDEFVKCTVLKIEQLPWHAVAATVEAFVGRGNFQVVLAEGIIDVFQLLENVCKIILRNRSSKVKSVVRVEKTPIAENMFWASLTVKFSSHGKKEGPVGHLWEEYVIKDCEHLALTDDVIAAVERGLEFGKQLKLSPEVSFGILHIKHLLALPTVRPFKHIRTFLQRVNLMNYLYGEGDLEDFMETLLQSYSNWMNECSEDLLSIQRSLHEAIREGLAFLEELHTLMNKKHWTSKELAQKFQQWFMLLIQLVDVKNPDAAQCLKLFLDHKSPVCKEHRKTTHTRVKNVVKANFQEITIKQFCSLYKVFYRQWEINFLQKYLTNYNFQDHETITQVWSEFFQEVVKNYRNPQDHQLLIEFLKRTGKFYAVAHTPFNFLVDLLAIEVPQLFAHQHSDCDHYSEFSTLLQDYVSGWDIEEKVPLILNRLSMVKCQSSLVDLIMTVMMQNFFQKDVTTLLLPLRSVVEKLTANNGLKIKMTSSPLEIFCWRFLADFCTKIVFQAGPNWIEIELLQPAILELATVCKFYCITKEWTEKECLRAICDSQSLPEDISGSLNETVKYFEWVKSAQGVLHRWHTRLDGHTVNYDDILHYQQQKPFFQELSQRLFAHRLVVDESKSKQHFEKRFEELHVLLLRYIGNEPDGRWCTLIELLRQLGIMMPNHIQETLDKYIQFPNEIGKPLDSFPQNTIPSSVTSKFRLTEKGLPLALKATTGLTLKRLDGLVRSLNQFLQPINTYLDMLIFFTLRESRMFVTYVRYELKRSNTVDDKVQHASQALESTSLLIWDIVNGKAKYRDIVAGRTLNLETLNIDKELNILRQWVTSENPNKVLPDFFTLVKAQLQLSKFATNIDVIFKVCSSYDLQGCLEDSQLIQLVELATNLKDDDKRDEISLEEAKLHKMEVERALYLRTDSDYKCLDLFPAIADSKDFFTFVRTRQFIGKAGHLQFQTFLELITGQLQHDSDEYEQTVLNHLSAAFQLISPFTDKSQTFSGLMSKVVRLDVSHGLVQLQTVKNNLHLIDLWISRAEGDTLQNAITDLENVLQTGFFRFHVEESGIYAPPRLVLEYNPFAHKTKEFASRDGVQSIVAQEASKERPCVTTHTETWNSEEISSFVQMLGLLDQEETNHSEKITRFQRLNEIAEKLLCLFTTLKELGHPDYLHKTFPAKVLACSDDDQFAESKVEEAQNNLNVWKHQIEEWNNQYPHLLFFTIPKVLRLHESLLKEPNVVESSVAKEIAFLFRTDKPGKDQLRHSIKKVLEKQPPSCPMPMPNVGEFLRSLLSDVELTPQRYIPQRYLKVELHYTPGFDKTQLLSIIFGIYQGVPESFEFFHCSSDTTELDLKRFVERMWKHARTYMMFGVNNLSLYLQEVFVQHFESQQALAKTSLQSTLHCIEMSPSSLREIPWIQLKEHQTMDPLVSVENTTKICRKRLLPSTDIEAVYLVYGQPGDGKTHFVRRMLQDKEEYPSVTITVNEGFTTTGAILELTSLPEGGKRSIVFFNFTFTLLPSDYKGCEPKEREKYDILIDSISWFFFDLLVLGYVEDRDSGLSFRLPGDLSWTIYVEVPCSCWPEDISDDSTTSLEKSLSHFQSEIPILGLLGTPHLIDHQAALFADDDVQLVCKYLRAYHDRTLLGINRLYVETAGMMGRREGKPVKFSTKKDIPQPECNKLLLDEMSKHIRKSKIIQKLYIRYMHRRCKFLDNCPAFNYNMGCSVPGAEDTSTLGSTLMRAMLKEVTDFCNPEILKNWSCKPHQQLIYDYRGGGTIGYISLNTENLPKDDVVKLRRIGVQIPTQSELHSRKYLDECLSRALNLPLEKQADDQEHLPLIDECRYVLTLDYTIKMLSIHERHECRMPVIIEGETGVGKTALVEMLSKLWNYSWSNVLRKNKDDVLTFLCNTLQDREKLAASENDSYKACRVDLTKMFTTAEVREDVLDNILKLPDPKSSQVELFQVVRDYLLKDIQSVCPVEMLRPLGNHKEVKSLFESVSREVSKETTLELLYALLTTELKQTFYKLQVHAALQPKDIWEFFDGVILQAENLQRVCSTKPSDEGQHSTEAPIVTVFLDELNTSTCGGIFKEIIVDRTMNSKEIPFNVFIIAACNPHRGNSLAPTSPDETWVRGSYYVHQLHPTLRYLMWDYGALDELQERRYIEAKIKLLHDNLRNTKVDALTNPIVRSQNLMRKYAQEQLLACNLPTSDAETASKSTVSQRDIQRFFTFYQWFLKMYGTLDHHEGEEKESRAMLVALSLVYYMRLNSKYRGMYKHEMEEEMAADMKVNMCFEQVYQSELEWLISEIRLPTGIARTQALKENLFAIVTCTMTHTPLILVGAPGSSKTLSFHLVAENLRGKESDGEVFKKTEIFSAIDPLFYQCSKQTTSNELNTVFTRAINRQSTYGSFALPIKCVVLMDEAGLPEESLESLKALHYHLDQQDVSFVGITNHILDAAKSNRAVSLVVPEPSKEDLVKLAKDCFCDMYNAETRLPQATPAAQNMVSDLVESQAQISPLLSPEAIECARLSANELIRHCCEGYYELMKLDSAELELQYPFHKFFGLRDFIYFLGYLRRKLLQELKSARSPKLTSALLLEGLERNFNGTGSDDFHYICRKFLKATFQDQEESQPEFRSVTEILRDSLLETPVNISGHGEVRYKLIIDPSEDNSLIRHMFTFGILRMENTLVHMCSNLADSHLEKINTIAAIRHSAVEGHTAILSQIDSIQESFYDLFNQRFRCIKNPVTNEHRYYANVAIGAHSKPSRVNPNFQCIVLLKECELSATPAPFLNRFEKYRITYDSLIKECMANLPPFMRIVLETAVDKVNEFVQVIEATHSLYGYREDTIPSLLLKLLPPPQYVIQPLQQCTPVVPVSTEVSILHTILYNLRLSFGFYIPQISDQELQYDAEYLFGLVESEIQHSSLEELKISTSTVIETFKILKSIPDSSIAKSDIQFTDDIGLIFRLVVQWFIHYLCKSLMQLMTPEALALLHKRIPDAHSQSYLVLQEHFSLKCLLSHYCELQETSGRTDTCVINKVLCFSRSTPKFPHFYSKETSTDANMASFLERAVFSDVSQLVVMKLSVSTSQRNIREILKKFSTSLHDRVLLLTVNTLKISHDAINHLRILIDEAETLSSGKKKLFVLLLHFPDIVFGRLSYPSLFLEGWNHQYITFIPTGHPEYIVDTKQWFKHSVFPKPGNPLSSEENMLEVVNDLFPILTSRVGFTASTAERSSDMLKKLLFNNNSHVGRALCRRFLGYWTQQTTAEYLHQAAYSIQKSDSTLWLSSTLQKMFKSKFFDYLVYMVSKIHADCNILSLTELKHSDTMMKLFVDIILTYPCPKLSQLKLNSMLGSIPSTVFCEHRFPFFGLLSKLVDDEIDHCKVLGPLLEPEKADDDDDDEIHHLSKQANVVEFQLVDEAQKRLHQVTEDKDNSCLAVAINRLGESDDLWDIYFSDFAREKLHVGGETSDTIIKSLSQWHRQKVHQISKQGAINSAIAKLVSLHVSVQHLSKVISILRPIADLEKIAQKISSKGTITFPQLEPEGSIFEKPEDICLCVVSSFFQPLVQALIGQKSAETLKTLAGSWNAVYQMIKLPVWSLAVIFPLPQISIPLFKKWIYEHLSSQTEAKFNLMHTVHLVYSFDPSDEECRDIGNVVFGTLYNRYFEPEKCEIRTECPHLQQLADVVVGALVHKRDTKHIAYVVEGLLEHCFSEYRKQYHTEDINWFLELVNHQLWKEIYGTDSIARGHLWDVLRPKISEEHVPSGSISLNVFKFYLLRILSKSKDVSFRHSVVVPWNNEARLKIGGVLVAAHQPFDPPGSYIPAFYANHYTQCKQKVLMQQPLAHLYFYTTLEYLVRSFHKKKLSSMLEFVNAIEQEYQDSEEGHERMMLLIEKQALVQAIIRESACALATSKGREAVVVLKDDLNCLFDDEEMGGSRADGKPSGHGVALAMHTVWQMKSFEKFLHLLDGTILMDINCLKPFVCSGVESINLPSCHLFPFMLPGRVQSQDTVLLSTLYQQLCKCMCDVHHSTGAATRTKIKALLTFTEKKLHDHLPIISSSHIKAEKAACTRLFLWLCTYHEFYKKNVKSEELAKVIREKKMVELLGGEQYAQLIQCFLNPDLMVSRDEYVAKNLPHVSRHEPDPLYTLFHTSDLDHLNVELRHAIANVVAAVLGSPEGTTHLWWHLFSPGALANTYMTGFLFDSPVSREKGTFYNYGVQLKSGGIYAKHSYHKHATRGTLSLHSLYPLLWMNFSAFCVGLITRQYTEEQLRMLLSDDLPVRSYCISQVRSLWSYMRNNLLALDEELAFLIQRCCNSLLQKSLVIKRSSHGKFDTKDKLNVYERWWHTRIFMPSKQEMDEQFLVHSSLCNHKSFQDIRLMAIHYPKFPTENEFLRHVLGFADEQDPCIQLLLQFALEYPRLELARSLLPELVDLYLWLHTDLAHMISRDTAQKTTVKQLMAHLEKYYQNDHEKLKKLHLFHSVKDHFNQYAHTTGVIPDDDNALLNPRVFKIEDNTLVIQLLSVPLQSDQKSNDQLYKVIMDLVKTHNHIMELLSKVAASCSHEPMCCHVFANANKVHLPEVSENTSSVENFSKIYQQSKYLQLIRRRCIVPNTGEKDHTPATLPQFDLHWLLQDIVATFLSGKPQIHNPSTQHIPYCFRVPPNRTRAHLSENAAQELANINHKLPQGYKQPLGDGHLKTLEYRFHNEPLETYDEVVTGLTTSAQYLIDFHHRSDDILMRVDTLKDFLCEVYQNEKPSDAFKRAGFTSLSSHQLSCFLDMKLQNFYNALQVFVQWIEDGYYDFRSLPYATKSHLSEDDEPKLQHLVVQAHYGTPMELLKDLKRITVLLNQIEPNIVKIVSTNPQEPIANHLSVQRGAKDDECALVGFIPDSVQVRHYVAFRVALRRLTLEVERCLPPNQRKEEEHFTKFEEFVTDLWKKRMGHVQREPGGSLRKEESTQVASKDYTDDAYLDEYSVHGDESSAETSWQPSEEDSCVEDSDEWVEDEPTNIMATILKEIYLHKHLSLFADEHVDEGNLQEIANEDLLHSIGVESALDRLKIIMQIQKYKSGVRGTQGRTTTDVAEFLRRKLNMEHYVLLFQEYRIDGDLLLRATDEILKEIGIHSAYDRLKIRIAFRREVLGPSDLAKKYPVAEVVNLLKAHDMDAQYQLLLERYEIDGEMLSEASDQVLKENGIDGDLLLNAMDEILKEIGIQSALDRLKIRIAFRREVLGPSDLAKKYPVAEVVNLLKAHAMDAQYQLLLERNEIDGEMLSEASDQVLKEIGIKSRMHQRKIRNLIQK